MGRESDSYLVDQSQVVLKAGGVTWTFSTSQNKHPPVSNSCAPPPFFSGGNESPKTHPLPSGLVRNLSGEAKALGDRHMSRGMCEASETMSGINTQASS